MSLVCGGGGRAREDETPGVHCWKTVGGWGVKGKGEVHRGAGLAADHACAELGCPLVFLDSSVQTHRAQSFELKAGLQLETWESHAWSDSI